MQLANSITNNNKKRLVSQSQIFFGSKRNWFILIGFIVCASLDILVATSTSVANDHIVGFLNATYDEVNLSSVGYFSAKLIFLILTVKFSNVLGGKRLFQYSLMSFILGAFLCGTTTSSFVFLLGRILLGAGSAAFYTLAQAVLFNVFPLKTQGRIQALFSVAIVLGPNIIPAYSGWLTYHYAWQLIFLSSVIIGLLALPLTNLLPPSVLPKGKSEKISWISVFWLSVGLISFQFVLQEGARYDWFEDDRISILTFTAILGIAFFLYQNKKDNNTFKIIDFTVYKNSSFALAFLISFVSGFALFGSGSIIPGFLHKVLRYNSADVGYIFLPSGIAIIIGLVVSAFVVDTKKIPPFASAATGALCVITSMILVSDITIESGFSDMVPATMLRGLGLGLLFVPIIFIAFNELKGGKLLTATGLFNFGRQCGGSMAMAFLPTYLTHQMAYHRKNLLSAVDPYNNILFERTQNATQLLISQGYHPTEAEGMAMGTVNIALNVQSAVLAFQNTFFAISIVFLCAAPIIIATKIYLKRTNSKVVQHI